MTIKINEKIINNILRLMGNTFIIKNANYGNSFEISVNKYGLIAALTRISDKFNRAETLILNNNKGTSDETLVDTLIDLANYCVMTAAYIKSLGENTNENNER